MSRSQAGNVRIILIGVLIILIALIGAGVLFGYSAFKFPSQQPAGPSVAVRSKIAAPPMKVPHPQKIQTPRPGTLPAMPKTKTDPPGQPVVAIGAPAATETASDPASGQDAPPKLQTAQSPAETTKPSSIETIKEPAQVTEREPELSKARNEQQVRQAQPTQPASAQTAAVPVLTEEKPAPFTTQVGAYLTKAYAEDMQTDLEQRGYETFIYQTRDKQQRTWYMVRVGHFENRPAAEMFLSDFTAKENMPAVIALSKKR